MNCVLLAIYYIKLSDYFPRVAKDNVKYNSFYDQVASE
jgi:hypothetical protein